MTLRLVGAGLGRTGTHSLKLALEQLLGGPCYHMFEVLEHPEHVPTWQRAAQGEPPDWARFLAGYAASVDWPAAAFWRELADANPDAVVLLSRRDDAEAWWASAERTIFAAARRWSSSDPELASQGRMVLDLLRARFTEHWSDHDAAVAAYERHNDEVRSTARKDRLVEWRPGDGWAPICRALGLAVPDRPFPHVNTTDEFRAMAGLDRPPA